MKSPLSTRHVCVLLLKLLVLSTFDNTGGSAGGSCEDARLVRAAQCPGQVISRAHRYRTLGARSVLECVSICRPDASCLSVVFDAQNKTCYLGNSTASANCSNMVAGPEEWKHYEMVSDFSILFSGYV